MLLQVLLAGVLAVPFFFRRVIADALGRFRRGDRPSTSADAPEDTDSRP
jgi:hypothetical protein